MIEQRLRDQISKNISNQLFRLVTPMQVIK